MSIMAQHTPGPWALEIGMVTGSVWISQSVGGVKIPLFECSPITGAPDEVAANARLMSISPEFFDYIRRSASNCPEANELLKRATGEQS